MAIAGSIAISVWFVPKADAQLPLLPFLPNLQPSTSSSNDSDSRVVSHWVYLDGRRLIKLAGPRANLTERVENVQENLQQISQNYFDSPEQSVKVQTRTSKGLPVIYVNNQYLMTVTRDDAQYLPVDGDPAQAAEQISTELVEELTRAKQERQTSSLIRQGAIAAGSGLTIILISWGLYQWQCRSRKHSAQLLQPPTPLDQPLTTQLRKQQVRHLHEAKKRLFQLTQGTIWGGGTFYILGLFPYTRSLQLAIFLGLQIPLKIGIVIVGTYVATRFSYALIDRFTSAIVNSSALLTPENSERLQLRVSTISGVTKSIVTIAWVAVGILVALTFLGINIIPLLAGAGLVGVAVSLASQSLIKDAINGFLIILEDQYALGDVITVGNLGGLVENMNLRITQVRDAEGRLITIPNSEIKIVANLSSRWSRADLNIPIAYNADVNKALKLIETVALDMDRDPRWQEQIIETPQILGVDNFGDRGLIIRVWIKTQPLKQWEVAREFRRRLKVAFDEAGINIPQLQPAVFVHDALPLKAHLDGKGN
ncbi:mechanosensitive ion channel family protein [Iningainema tapete]|uniref:Mechanosensitive ion channel family protein n=1 Tax=Iningainema tapete BLCC-T55 TaxID=2748662 RepID=A0A8J6XF46_9CYAN|nr:mechanosensitive ion channel family protein [Iningainema tapete]MBD2774474.1 mechanosensitive ion channel family protein [Iningainema tapete BLCC-T55]